VVVLIVCSVLKNVLKQSKKSVNEKKKLFLVYTIFVTMLTSFFSLFLSFDNLKVIMYLINRSMRPTINIL